jgi:hypothetical protein
VTLVAILRATFAIRGVLAIPPGRRARRIHFALFEVAIEQGKNVSALKKKLEKLAKILEPASGV